MNNTSIMSDHFTFLHFKKKFKITKLCRPEGEKGWDVVSKDDVIFHRTNKNRCVKAKSLLVKSFNLA